MGKIAELLKQRIALGQEAVELKQRLLALVPENLKDYFNHRGEKIFGELFSTGLATDVIYPLPHPRGFESVDDAVRKFQVLQQRWSEEVEVRALKSGGKVSPTVYLGFSVLGYDLTKTAEYKAFAKMARSRKNVKRS